MLEGRVAIITGGGTNLGKAAAEELARCGASVVIAGRRADVLEAAADEIAERWSGAGVSVAAIALGRFATDSLRKYPVELWRRAAATVPLQRLGEVEEYGWLVALLASPLGRSFSGSVVTLDGALDNWQGPWPPAELVTEGDVPTEERRRVG